MAVLVHADPWDREARARPSRQFDLAEILSALRPRGDALTWWIFHMWALAGHTQVWLVDRGSERTLDAEGAEVPPACGDLAGPLALPALAAFSKFEHQVIDGLFVGTEPGSGRPASLPQFGSHVEYLEPDADWYRAYPIVLHAFDSSYWRIYIRDDADGAAITKAIPQARELARW